MAGENFKDTPPTHVPRPVPRTSPYYVIAPGVLEALDEPMHHRWMWDALDTIPNEELSKKGVSIYEITRAPVGFTVSARQVYRWVPTSRCWHKCAGFRG